LYAYNRYGAQEIRSLIQRVLCLVVQPLIKNICQWVYFGNLNDKYQEFFLTQSPERQDWEGEYSLFEKMVPSFMDITTAEKILKAGKAVNFLKKFCQENDFLIEGNLLT